MCTQDSKEVKYKKDILYAPDNQIFTADTNYTLLVSKAIRTSPEIKNNIVKVKDCRKDIRKDLTSIRPNDDAYFEVGTETKISEIVRESNGRIWGKLRNCYIVLENKDGTKQCEKMR